MERAMTISSDVITVTIGGKSYTTPRSSIYFEQVKDAIRRRASDAELTRLFDAAGAINQFTDGDFSLVDGQILYKGEETPNCVSDRILYLMQEKLPYSYMKNFWKRLALNPSRRAQQELYKFLEHKGMCITESGMVRAYKAIRNDWLDKHSASFSNRLGAVLVMPRNKVCDDADVGCSYGSTLGPLAA